MKTNISVFQSYICIFDIFSGRVEQIMVSNHELGCPLFISIKCMQKMRRGIIMFFFSNIKDVLHRFLWKHICLTVVNLTILYIRLTPEFAWHIFNVRASDKVLPIF